MSDIHGNFLKFKEMIKKINLKPNDTLYVLGDFIDRGSDSINLLIYIMNEPNIKVILGNHEDLMIETLRGDSSSKDVWFNVGGFETYKSYNKLTKELKRAVFNYLCFLPLFIIKDNFILTHSGLNLPKYIRNKNLTEIIEFQDRQDFIWSGYNFYQNPAIDTFTVIFGHTPTYNIDSRNSKNNKMFIWHDDIYKDKICLDCGEGFENGRLACLCLDTMKEFYI